MIVSTRFVALTAATAPPPRIRQKCSSYHRRRRRTSVFSNGFQGTGKARGGRSEDRPPRAHTKPPNDADGYLIKNGITSKATILMTLIIGLIAGPAVSL